MLGAHGASVESCLHVHDGNARYVVPCPYRALNRRRAAPAGKKGGMDIQTTLSRGSQIGRHTSELQSLMRNSYAVFCLKKKIHKSLAEICLQYNITSRYEKVT